MRLRATGPDLAARKTSPRAKRPAKEIVVVVDDEDEEEGEKAAKANLPTSLDQRVGHGIHTRLGKSKRSSEGVNLSAGSRTNCGQWQHAPTG